MKRKQEKFHLVVFGHRGRRLRQAQGLTQEQLAERMDCSLTYISKLENGRASCSMDRLFELADVLGCDAGLLLTGANCGGAEYLQAEFAEMFAQLPRRDKETVWLLMRAMLERSGEEHAEYAIP